MSSTAAATPTLAAYPHSMQVTDTPSAAIAARAGLVASFPRLVPALWITGLDFLAPMLFLALVVVQERRLRFGALTHFAAAGFALCAALTLSVAVSGVEDHGRAFSSLYSIAVIGCGTVLYNMVYRRVISDDGEFFRHAAKAMHRLFWSCLALIAIAVPLALLTKAYRRELPTLLGLALPFDLPGIADRSMAMVLTQPDWGLGFMAFPRVFVFSPWYTAGAMTLYLSGLFALVWCVLSGRSRRRELLLDALLFLAIVLTLTRTVLAIYVIAFFISSLVFRDRRRLLACGCCLLLAIAAVAGTDIVTRLLEFRLYSTEARFEAYFLGLSETLQRNPFTGIGYKPQVAGLHIPVGSHSTFVSLFVRGGIIAVLLFLLLFYLVPARQWLAGRRAARLPENRRLHALLFRVQLGAWGWVFFQEFDTAAVAATLLFISLALCHGALVLARRRADPA